MSEPWLTKGELARELKVSKRTIDRLCPPSMRVGRQNRYKLSEVVAYLQADGAPSADVIMLAAHR